MTEKNGNSNPAWRCVDKTIDEAERAAGRTFHADEADAQRVTRLQQRKTEDGDLDAHHALAVAATEGNRRRIYWRNHQTVGTARWTDSQGKVFKKTGQFPLTVRAPQEVAPGRIEEVEVAVGLLTPDQLRAWVAKRQAHVDGEQVNIDVLRELIAVCDRYAEAKTVREACDMAGLDLMDLRFTLEA